MSVKVPCGGFMLGEGLVLSEDGKTLSVSGGGGSVPKPLTYDYMPEGYPTKTVGFRLGAKWFKQFGMTKQRGISLLMRLTQPRLRKRTCRGAFSALGFM